MGAAGSVKSFADSVNDDHQAHFQASSSSSASPSNTNSTKLGSNSTHSHIITSPKYDQHFKNLRNNDDSGWALHNKFESKNMLGDDSAGIDLDDLDLNLNLADEIDDQDTIDIGFVNESDGYYVETKHLASKSSDTPSQNAQVMDSSFNHKKLGLHLNGVFSVVGLKNGEMVSSGTDRILRFYKKLSTGSMSIEKRSDISLENVDAECVKAIKLDADVLAIAEIPVLSDFTCVATGMSDCSVRIWSDKISNERASVERERWACTASLVGHTQLVLCLAAYPHAPKEIKSSVLSTTVAQTISWATSFPATKSPGMEPSAAAAVDGVMVISGSADHTVRLWGMVLGGPTSSASPPSTTSWVCFRVLRGHRGSVTSVLAMDCNSGRMPRKKQRVVSGSDDGCMMIWDILSGDVLHKLSSHSAAINSMALRYQVGSPAHKDGPVLEFVVSASSDGRLLLWNVFTEKFEAELKSHEHAVLSVIVLADGRIVTGAVDGAIREWACYGGYGKNYSGQHQWLWSCRGELGAHSGAVKALSPLPSSSQGRARFLSGSADGHILWWEESGQS